MPRRSTPLLLVAALATGAVVALLVPAARAGRTDPRAHALALSSGRACPPAVCPAPREIRPAPTSARARAADAPIAPAPALTPAPAPVAPAASPEPDVPLPPGEGRVLGRVVDPARGPVPGVWIDLIQVGSKRSDEPFGTDDGQVRSGPDGRFSLDSAPGPRVVTAILTAYRLGTSAPLDVTVGAVVDVGDIPIERLGAGLLRPHVVTTAGRPFEGRLRVTAESADGERSASGYERFSVDAAGVASPDTPISIGRFNIAASLAGYAARPVLVEVDDGQVVEPRLELARLPGLHVLVVDDATDAPVEHAVVALQSRGGSASTRTYEDGHAYFAAEAGPATLQAEAEGFMGLACGSRRAAYAQSLEIEVDDRGLADGITLRLLHGLAIDGTVLSPARRPCPGATVGGPGHTAKADAEGRFHLAGLAPGTVQIIAVGLPFAPVTQSLTLAEGGIPPVELVLGEAGAISGRVTGPGGAPVLDGVVSIRELPAGEAGESVPTGRDGSYRVDGLPPGMYEVEVAAPRLAPRTAAAVDVRAGETLALDVPLERGGTISGRVLDDAGVPVRDAYVGYEAASGRALSAQSDGEGRFVFEGLADEPAALLAQAPRHAPARLESIRPGAGEIDLPLPRSAVFRMRPRAPAGVDLPTYGAWRQISPEGDGGWQHLRHDRDRPTFSVEAVPGEVRAIGLAIQGFAAEVVAQPSLAPGEDLEVAVDLRVGVAVRGRALDAQGQPLVGAWVSLVQHPLEEAQAVRTDDSGAFFFPSVTPGAADVMLTGMPPREVTIGAGGLDGLVVRAP